MPLPSSGEISMSEVATEFNVSQNSISLANLGASPYNTTPIVVGQPVGLGDEFYGESSIGLTSELYSDNLGSSTSWDTFDGANEIDLTPFNGRTCRLAIHYSNGTTGTSYQGDFQIGSIISFGTTSLNFQYNQTDWQTTRANTAATKTAYDAATFYQFADGTTSGRWNRRNTSAPPSSGTGLAPGSGNPPGTQYYAYTETSGASSTMLGYGFWLRGPAVTFASSGNDIELDIAHFGSNMGTYKVFLDVTV